MPPRTSMEQRSVAPVKSSAIAPSSMASSSRWERQYVAVTDGYGKPAAQRLAKPRFLPRGDGIGARRLRAACGVGRAIDQRALHAERACAGCASRSAPMRSRSRARRARSARCSSAECRTKSLVAPHVAPERRAHQRIVWMMRRQTSRPSTVRQARNGTVSVVAQPRQATLPTPDRAARCRRPHPPPVASHRHCRADPGPAMTTRQRPRNVAQHSPHPPQARAASTPAAHRPAPSPRSAARRAHAAVRPNASSSSAASASTSRIQS